MKKVLFIAVHPDDETLGCGGTIIKHKQKGDEVYWLIITAVTSNHLLGSTEQRNSQGPEEIKCVAAKYGFERTIELGFPEKLLDTIDFTELVSKIDKVINEIQPKIIYIVNRSDVHSHHRIAFEAVFSCTKNFRKPFIERILMYETLSETEFAPAFSENAFIPNVFIDVSDYMGHKLDIMSVYQSEVMPDYMPRSFSAIKALAAFRGCRIGVQHAEAFMLLFEKC